MGKKEGAQPPTAATEQAEASEPGSDTERFRALVNVEGSEAVTGESGVPAKLRDHERRCQQESLDEFC